MVNIDFIVSLLVVSIFLIFALFLAYILAHEYSVWRRRRLARILVREDVFGDKKNQALQRYGEPPPPPPPEIDTHARPYADTSGANAEISVRKGGVYCKRCGSPWDPIRDVKYCWWCGAELD